MALLALGHSRRRSQLERAAALLLTADVSEAAYVITGMTTHALGRQVAWEFVQQHFDVIEQRLGAVRAVPLRGGEVTTAAS